MQNSTIIGCMITNDVRNALNMALWIRTLLVKVGRVFHINVKVYWADDCPAPAGHHDLILPGRLGGPSPQPQGGGGGGGEGQGQGVSPP